MDGAEEELPDDARGEDLSSVSGRLRAAMLLNNVAPTDKPHRALIDFLSTRGLTIDRRTAHNWFGAGARKIDHEYLFKVAEALGVAPRWLATGEAPIRSLPSAIPPGALAVVAAWVDLPVEHQMAMLTAMLELKKQLRARGQWVLGVSPDRRKKSVAK